jgi:hypothetical protein
VTSAPGEQRPVLYAVACGSPVAGHLDRMVSLAQQGGWQVWVVLTPDACRFADADALTEASGHAVHSEFRAPTDPDPVPQADAIVVAPATVNTINKWACGVADTLALGLLIEAFGLAIPTVAVPYTNTAMAVHPAFRESLRRLRSWGVRVLFGDDVMLLPHPGSGACLAVEFPWQLALSALGPARHRPDPPPKPLSNGPSAGAAERVTRGRVRRLAPPVTPRPAPSIPRSR